MTDEPAPAHRSARFLTEGEAGAGHGVYFRAELADLGVDARDRRRMLRDGALGSPRKGWYTTGGHDPQVAAAVRSGGVLSCVSALGRYGFWVAPAYPEQHVRCIRWAEDGDASCRGFTPMRAGTRAVDSIVTALECAARCMREEDWIAVCDSVQQLLGVSAGKLRGELGPLPKRVLEMFGRTDGRSQSGTESIARVRLRSLGFAVIVQPQITEVARADLRLGRLILECDSRQYHADLESYQNDRTRDRKATVGKWLTFRLTYDDILYGWAEVVEDIRAITNTDRHRRRPSRRRSPQVTGT